MSLSIFLPYHPTYVDLCIPTHSLLILPSYWHSFNQENKENFKLSGGKQMMRNCTAYQDITVKHIRMLQSYISWYYSQTYRDDTVNHIRMIQSGISGYYSQTHQDTTVKHVRMLHSDISEYFRMLQSNISEDPSTVLQGRGWGGWRGVRLLYTHISFGKLVILKYFCKITNLLSHMLTHASSESATFHKYLHWQMPHFNTISDFHTFNILTLQTKL